MGVSSYEIIRLSVDVPVSYAIDPFVGVVRASLTAYDAGSLMQNAGTALPVSPVGHFGGGTLALGEALGAGGGVEAAALATAEALADAEAAAAFDLASSLSHDQTEAARTA
jgi:hypothetical protein